MSRRKREKKLRKNNKKGEREKMIILERY